MTEEERRTEKKKSERYEWLKKNVVFLHQSVGEDRRPEWSIHGQWPGYKDGIDFKSLDAAIDAAMEGR